MTESGAWVGSSRKTVSGPSMHEAEEFATSILQSGSSPRKEHVERLFDLLPHESPARGLGATACNFGSGAYAKGVGIQGLRKECVTFPQSTRLLTSYVHSCFPDHEFSSVILFCDAQTDIHVDSRNYHSPNAVMGISSFSGGQIWVGPITKTIEGWQVTGTRILTVPRHGRAGGWCWLPMKHSIVSQLATAPFLGLLGLVPRLVPLGVSLMLCRRLPRLCNGHLCLGSLSCSQVVGNCLGRCGRQAFRSYPWTLQLLMQRRLLPSSMWARIKGRLSFGTCLLGANLLRCTLVHPVALSNQKAIVWQTSRNP